MENDSNIQPDTLPRMARAMEQRFAIVISAPHNGPSGVCFLFPSYTEWLIAWEFELYL